MNYWRHVRSRVLQAIPTLIGLSMLMFVLTRLVPGDPVRNALGPRASEEQVRALEQQMGLDQPIYIQYVDWLTGIITGDWGMSLQTDSNVLSDLIPRLPATLELVIVGLIFAVLIAVPLGVIAGSNKDHWPDHVSRFAALIGVSLPRFWVAILLQVILVVGLGLFPLTGRLSSDLTAPPMVTGFYLIDSILAGQWDVFKSAAYHMVLPAVSIGLGTVAQVSRLIRSEMIDVSRKNYVLAARAYGLPQNLIVVKYMLKNAFTSSLTIIGLSFGTLLANSFVIEIVFSWPGMARYGVRSIIQQDFNAVIGVVMIVGVAYLLANLLVDLLYGYLDPRILLGGHES